MQDRRIDDRRRVMTAGSIVVPRTGAAAACILRDLSVGGARLLVAAPRDVPDDVALMAGPGGEPRWARVAWRGEAAVGIAFVAPERAAPQRDGEVVSLASARAARLHPSDAERLADRVAAVTRPRVRPLPSWVLEG